MAYITKVEVSVKNQALQSLNKRFGVKATFSGSNTSKLTLTVHSGALDFIANYGETTQQNNATAPSWKGLEKRGYLQVNHYYLERAFSGVCLDYMMAAYAIMTEGHYDNSDSMTDYFNCAWYNGIQVGKWDKPYICTDKAGEA